MLNNKNTARALNANPTQSVEAAEGPGTPGSTGRTTTIVYALALRGCDMLGSNFCGHGARAHQVVSDGGVAGGVDDGGVAGGVGGGGSAGGRFFDTNASASAMAKVLFTTVGSPPPAQ